MPLILWILYSGSPVAGLYELQRIDELQARGSTRDIAKRLSTLTGNFQAFITRRKEGTVKQPVLTPIEVDYLIGAYFTGLSQYPFDILEQADLSGVPVVGSIQKLVKDGVEVSSAKAGDRVQLILNQTPFYAESGGQVGDQGYAQASDCLIQINDTKIRGDNRLTINSGIGYRKLSNDKSSFAGSNIFIDYDEEGNSRASIGLELRASSFENMSKKFNVKVDSAGVANYHTGYPPDKRSIYVAQKNGIDISTQKARQIKAKDFSDFDYIFVMDKQNFYDIKELISYHKVNSVVQLLNDPFEIEDPYYGNDEGFEIVYDKIYQGCKRVIDNWK